MIEINLIKKRKVKRKVEWPLIIIICEIVFISAVGGWQYSRIVSLTKEKKSLSYVEAKLTDLRKDLSTLKKKIDVVKNLSRNRGRMIYVLRSAVDDLPRDAWLTNFCLKGNNVSINGRAKGAETVARYVRNLSVDGKYSNVSFKDYGIRRNDSYELEAVYDFSVGCNVR